MSEADLMLALNEALQKAGESIHTRFCRVRYAPSEAVSALLTENANAGVVIPRLSNVLIRAAKIVELQVSLFVIKILFLGCIKYLAVDIRRYIYIHGRKE